MAQEKLGKPLEKEQFLTTITTTRGSNWREKIEEINKLGLKEIALFPTCLQKKERKELYNLLKNSSIKNIPILHLRSDMELWELDYFIENYGTKVFNIHMQIEHPLIYDYSKYKNSIYIENIYYPFNEEELKKFGGICCDFAHLENDRLLDKKKFQHDIKIIEKYPIGSNHISAVKKFTHIDEIGKIRYDDHHLEDLSELDYLKRYSLKYFSPFIAIELANSIKDQLKTRDYIIELLNNLL